MRAGGSAARGQLARLSRPPHTKKATGVRLAEGAKSSLTSDCSPGRGSRSAPGRDRTWTGRPARPSACRRPCRPGPRVAPFGPPPSKHRLTPQALARSERHTGQAHRSRQPTAWRARRRRSWHGPLLVGVAAAAAAEAKAGCTQRRAARSLCCACCPLSLSGCWLPPPKTGSPTFAEPTPVQAAGQPYTGGDARRRPDAHTQNPGRPRPPPLCLPCGVCCWRAGGKSRQH